MRAGNVYVNRNIIGAVVGVQPFGGHGLSGTGPKAGGPLYLLRLLRRIDSAQGEDAGDSPPADARIELPGPTGESNVLEFHPRGIAACIADHEDALVAQARAALAVGNSVLMLRSGIALHAQDRLRPGEVALTDSFNFTNIDVVLLDTDAAQARCLREQLAATPGKIVPLVLPDASGRYDWRRLVTERAVTINTAAAGGNTALLSLSEAGSGI